MASPANANANGPVTSVGGSKKGNRDNGLSFNRWEKSFLHLAQPVFSEENPEEVVAYDLFLQVQTGTIDAEAQLLASLDQKSRDQLATLDETLRKMLIDAYMAKLPKQEFPTSGNVSELPLARVRIDPFCNMTLISGNADGTVDYHTAELAVQYHEYMQPKLQKHTRGIETLGIMIEASGFYMISIDGDSWKATPRRENDDLASELSKRVSK